MEIKTSYGIYPRVQMKPVGKSRTKQSFMDETNINNILKKYDRETMEQQMLNNPGNFIDLPSGLDYQTALNMAINARDAFNALPGTLRANFQNDAKIFLDFMEDPENEEEIVEMGLREPQIVQEDISAPPEPPTVAPAGNIENTPE